MAKPFLTYEQQLEKLAFEKRLVIDDPVKATALLKDIGYFSLVGGYKTPFINPMTRIYLNGTTIEDIYALYSFDSDLRELAFKYICIVERKIRQLISYSFCKAHGEQQSEYLDPAGFSGYCLA